MSKKFLEGTLPMDLKNNNFFQLGFSLAEALMAVIISTLVMSTSYYIYNNFQKTFVRQINHNVIKQEVRFAVHNLQKDLKVAGYKHIDSADNIQRAIHLEDSDGNDVSDNSEADTVYACLDTLDNSNNIQRKIIRYELRKEQSTDANKTILMKQVYNTNNCVDSSEVGTLTWLPVAKHFKKFKITKSSNNILNFEIQMEDPAGQVIEKYNAAAFMRNVSYGTN
jgi:type II secretory pathway component PulJ